MCQGHHDSFVGPSLVSQRFDPAADGLRSTGHQQLSHRTKGILPTSESCRAHLFRAQHRSPRGRIEMRQGVEYREGDFVRLLLGSAQITLSPRIIRGSGNIFDGRKAST